MLDVEGVVKRYLPPPAFLRPFVRVATSRPVDALRNVSFKVDAGEVVGLVGPNGAGKTSLIKIIGTLLEPTDGTVTVGGADVRHDPAGVRRRLGLLLADDRGLYWRLTGRQNLELFGVLAGLTAAAAAGRADHLLDRFDLGQRDKLVFGYSSGMRSRLSLARAVLAEPPLLVLDEPTRSMDPVATADVGRFLRGFAATGRAVLLSSHRLDEVVTVCDRVVVMLEGQVRYDGTVDAAESLSELLTELTEHPTAP